nr:uncharacterized protein LOC112427336 [Macaca nemestrina]
MPGPRDALGSEVISVATETSRATAAPTGRFRRIALRSPLRAEAGSAVRGGPREQRAAAAGAGTVGQRVKPGGSQCLARWAPHSSEPKQSRLGTQLQLQITEGLHAWRQSCSVGPLVALQKTNNDTLL